MNAEASTPRVLVVYESMFGNTAEAAQAVARGLEGEGCRVDVVEVSSAPATLPADLALLLIGAPTHAFSLSRPSTRADAVRAGAPELRATTGVREWLTGLSVPHPTRLAVFDTRVAKVRWIPKAAGSAAARLAKGKGLSLLDRPFNFLVEDTQGPLQGGQVEMAERWGRDLGVAVQTSEVRRTAS
jgi:hypothetical protein